MYYRTVLTIMCFIYVNGSGIYHENTKITFTPNMEASYFGYSVALNRYGLLVGAPKAKLGLKPYIETTTGKAFNCSLKFDTKTVTCESFSPGAQVYTNMLGVPRFYKSDMWFGATIASLSDDKTLICAPRYTEPYGSKHILAHGICLLEKKDKKSLIYPISDKTRQAFMTDGQRPEYGEYGTHLNFFAYGQAGMSMKVVDNGTIIIGAPGLLQWTGGIVYYYYSPESRSAFFSRQVIVNPYKTLELGPDDYFGYSVDAGVFNKNDSQTLFIGGAPRSMRGYGQVLIFEPPKRDQYPLVIHAKVHGPQLGAYFGASLCCLDIDGDGVSDLLVGAPNYVTKDGGLPHDQGAVFVYMTKTSGSNFTLEKSAHVMGSGASGARFGTAIADLGDIDGDGYRDVAIGAPWENDETGVVYIYRGSSKGLKSQYVQKIMAEGAKSFGISIAKGIDVDHNNCNDLAIGAAISSTAYLYRCIPTVTVHASIKVPDAMNLPHNATGFTALFCVSSPSRAQWSHVKAEFNTKIVIDPEENRATVSENSQKKVSISPGDVHCDEQTVDVKPTADLSKPILIKFFLEPEDILRNDSTVFNTHAARVSEDSVLQSSFLIQLMRDCGEDMICTPWLEMTWDVLDGPHYTPGTKDRLGAKLNILNKAEPAYGARVNITLPLIPKRVPSPCSLEDLVLVCDVPAPLFRDEAVTWEIELEYKDSNDSDDTSLNMVANLEDPLYNRNITDESVKEIVLEITPDARCDVAGKSLPNNTLAVTREKFEDHSNVTFTHFIEVSNFGPSNWHLEFIIALPEIVDLSNTIPGCEVLNTIELECAWFIPARISRSAVLPLRIDLGKYEELFHYNDTVNITTEVKLTNTISGNQTASITTTLILDPVPPLLLWPRILGAIVGIILLAAIVYFLYKRGFFSREHRERLKELKELQEPLTQSEPGSSSEPPSISPDEASQELLYMFPDE